jgi:hypothetical protein
MLAASAAFLLAAAAPGWASHGGAPPAPGKYAPEVRLAEEERFFPVRPANFIAHSELVWYGCGSEVERWSAPRPEGLGAASDEPYRSPSYWREDGPARPDCPPGLLPGDTTIAFPAGAWTRPQGDPAGGRAPRPEQLVPRPAEGFALDLRDEFRRGARDPNRIPVNYELGRLDTGWWITYWLFYAHNSKARSQHEGDWERISVRFGRHARPREVAYYAHDSAPRVCAYDEVEKAGKRHPVVYSAAGSHASFPAAGRFRVGSGGRMDRAFGSGLRWRTWLAGVRPATEPWYGFGGAWGERGADSRSTGPAGPGQRGAHDWDRKGRPCAK